MKSDLKFFIELIAAFLPFILFAFINSVINIKKQNRNRQYIMPIVAVVYCIVLMIFLDTIATFLSDIVLQLAGLFEKIGIAVSTGDINQANAVSAGIFSNLDVFKLAEGMKNVDFAAVAESIRNFYLEWGVYLELILFNTVALAAFLIVKGFVNFIFSKIKVRRKTFVGSLVELFYSYDAQDGRWYIKDHFGQACTYIKSAYYGCCFASALAILISCVLCRKMLISEPFYPVFAVIIIGEVAFFVDGICAEELKSSLAVQSDKSRRVAMYPLLRLPLRALFGDKLSAEGTTVNNGGENGGSIEEVLATLESEGGHIGQNYAAFIRRKMETGLKPNVDYVHCGYDLASGKSLLFNTPFYDKLNPYVFYAMNRELLTGGKVLIVLGRHGTEEDLLHWATAGIQEVSNIPDLWKISVLDSKKINEEDLPAIGIISRSGVHDLDIHKNNLPFLQKVSFVVVIEPSRLVTTAQIGLNLLIKCCGKDRAITFCSVDRNCDGLVDALSHILMTNITEVSATEYPHGMSSYMYWTADDDYLQHRILPGVSRSLGLGTELSMVALKNQVKQTVWYGGEAFPVTDLRWIAKQYYYDLLNYAQIPTTQKNFDKCFKTSFNMCDERVSDYSFITVEDDRNNLFETRRNFATIAEQQGFVNVISSEYMLREYMSSNTEVFTADAKAIPYITADYARTKRNAILSMCLLLCIDSVKEEVLNRQMALLNVETKTPVADIWKEVCAIFSSKELYDKHGTPILSYEDKQGNTVTFERDETIVFKREYSVESGKFESVYKIENAAFSRVILEDLQNASYIAEHESKDVYIGAELKGHVYQKYLPGQFFTLNGKYYEMIATATDNKILVRRASEHIGSRLAYRQIRNYNIRHLEDSAEMGALRTVNNIDIYYQMADFSVETPGYWKLRAHNDFDNGQLIKLNGIPVREYHNKQILKFDFSNFGEAFTDSVRITLTNLLNEAFVTLFADNQSFICAITPGSYEAPITYSLELDESVENADKSIFIIEDSQLDIGLLIAVERNIQRILNIISDYLTWNQEQIEESLKEKETPQKKEAPAPFDVYEGKKEEPKKGFFGKLIEKIKNGCKKIKEKVFKGKKPKTEEKADESEIAEQPAEVSEETPMEEPLVQETSEAAEIQEISEEIPQEAELQEELTEETATEAEFSEEAEALEESEEESSQDEPEAMDMQEEVEVSENE